MSYKMKGFSGFTEEKYDITESNIHGIGAIASKNIEKGELIGTAFDNEKLVKNSNPQIDTRTILGKSLNHQNNENAIQKSENNTLNVYAKKRIKKGSEITINYKDAPSYVSNAVTDDMLKEYKEI